MSREEFQRYWREQHGPLVQSKADALRIHRYVQVHSMPAEVNTALRDSRGAPDEFDGVAELWWESMEDLAAASATPEGRAAGRELLEDERKFIDLERSPLWLAEEHAFIGAP
jgi:uncharacterized protein (TIGR02118 family)